MFEQILSDSEDEERTSRGNRQSQLRLPQQKQQQQQPALMLQALNTLGDFNSSLSSRIAESRMQVRETKNKLRDEEQRRKELREELTVTIHDTDAEREDLLLAVDQLDQEAQSARPSLAKLKSGLSQLKDTLLDGVEKAEKRAAAFNGNQGSRSSRRRPALSSQTGDLKRELEKLDANEEEELGQGARGGDEASAESKQIEGLLEASEEAERVREALEKTKAQQEAELASVRAKLAAVEQEHAKAIRELEQHYAQVLQETVANAQQEQIKARRQDAANEAKQQNLAADLAAAQAQVSSSAAEAAAALKYAQDVLNNHQALKTELQGVTYDLRAERAAAAAEKEPLIADLAAARSMIEQLKKEVATAAEEIGRNAAKQDALEAEVRACHAQASEQALSASADRTQLVQLIDKLTEQLAEAQIATKRDGEAAEALRQEKRDLQHTNQLFGEEVANLQHELEVAKARIVEGEARAQAAATVEPPLLSTPGPRRASFFGGIDSLDASGGSRDDGAGNFDLLDHSIAAEKEESRKRVDELKDENARLEKELALLRAKMDETNRDLTRKEVEIAALGDEAKKNKEERDDLLKELRAVQMQAMAADLKTEDLQGRLARAIAESTRAAERHGETMSSSASERSRLMEKMFDASESERARLVEKAEALEVALRNAEIRRASLEGTLDAMRNENARLEENSRLAEEAASARESALVLEARLAQEKSRAQVQALEEQLAALKESLLGAEQSKEEALSSALSHQQKAASTLQEIHELEGVIAELQKNLQLAHENLNQSERNLRQSRDGEQELRVNNASLLEEKAAIEAGAVAAEQIAAQKLAREAENVVALQERKADLLAKIAGLEEELRVLRATLHEGTAVYHGEKAQLSSTLKMQEQETMEQKALIASLQKELDALLESKHQEASQFRDRERELQGALNALREEKASAIENLNAELEELKKSSKKSLKQEQEKTQQLRDAEALSIAKIVAAEAQIASLEKLLREHGEAKKQEADERFSLSSTVRLREQEMTNQKALIEALKRELDALLLQNKQESEHLQQVRIQERELQNSLVLLREEKAAESARLRTDIGILQKESDRLLSQEQNQVRLLIARETELSVNLAAAREELALLQMSLQEHTTAKGRYDSEKQQLENLSKQREESLKRDFDVQIQQLRRQHELGASEQIIALERRTLTAENDSKESLRTLENTLKELEKLREERDNAQKDLDAAERVCLAEKETVRVLTISSQTGEKMLLAQLATAHRNAEEANEAKTDARTKLAAATQEIEMLMRESKDLPGLHASLKETTSQLTDARAKLSNALAEIAVLNEKLANTPSLMEQLARTNRELELAKLDLRTLRSDLTKAKNENHQLSLRLREGGGGSATKEETGRKDVRIKELQALVEELEGRLNDLEVEKLGGTGNVSRTSQNDRSDATTVTITPRSKSARMSMSMNRSIELPPLNIDTREPGDDSSPTGSLSPIPMYFGEEGDEVREETKISSKGVKWPVSLSSKPVTFAKEEEEEEVAAPWGRALLGWQKTTKKNEQIQEAAANEKMHVSFLDESKDVEKSILHATDQQVKELTEEVSALRKELQFTLSRLENTLQSKQRLVKAAETTKEEYEVRIKRLNEQLAELMRDLQILQGRSSDAGSPMPKGSTSVHSDLSSTNSASKLTSAVASGPLTAEKFVELENELRIARANVKASRTSAQKASSATAIEMRQLRAELNDKVLQCNQLLQSNDTLQRAATSSEREYGEAAKTLITTVESHRQSQQQRIDDLTVKVSLAREKIRELKGKLLDLQKKKQEDKAAYRLEIEELRRELLERKIAAGRSGHDSSDDEAAGQTKRLILSGLLGGGGGGSYSPTRAGRASGHREWAGDSEEEGHHDAEDNASDFSVISMTDSI